MLYSQITMKREYAELFEIELLVLKATESGY